MSVQELDLKLIENQRIELCWKSKWFIGGVDCLSGEGTPRILVTYVLVWNVTSNNPICQREDHTCINPPADGSLMTLGLEPATRLKESRP
ncbi:hypothetical protein TNCT_119101 [Trichonephila clavata]|uniref:Uncharacterized protein n=1 Tax=Trichonephila clavata TaxID=2740835 RepID=A0A8X6FZ99_TRICU|nr:hypothetical protein TNCT_119101 [Trichonephila clavata]